VARLKSKTGVSVEDCKAVIDAQVSEWAGDPKMRKFLRPETLFNRTKFAGYLGALGTAHTSGHGAVPLSEDPIYKDFPVAEHCSECGDVHLWKPTEQPRVCHGAGRP
jgi:hypothetical protein